MSEVRPAIFLLVGLIFGLLAGMVLGTRITPAVPNAINGSISPPLGALGTVTYSYSYVSEVQAGDVSRLSLLIANTNVATIPRLAHFVTNTVSTPGCSVVPVTPIAQGLPPVHYADQFFWNVTSSVVGQCSITISVTTNMASAPLTYIPLTINISERGGIFKTYEAYFTTGIQAIFALLGALLGAFAGARLSRAS